MHVFTFHAVHYCKNEMPVENIQVYQVYKYIKLESGRFCVFMWISWCNFLFDYTREKL